MGWTDWLVLSAIMLNVGASMAGAFTINRYAKKLAELYEKEALADRMIEQATTLHCAAMLMITKGKGPIPDIRNRPPTYPPQTH
jgi:hypothetical protein